jgi:hypothetical protein
LWRWDSEGFLKLLSLQDLKMDEGYSMIQLDHRRVNVAPMLCLKIRVEAQVYTDLSRDHRQEIMW